MPKNRSCRRVLAALGGAAMLAGFGTTGTALAREFRAVLNGDNLTPAGDTDGWGRVAINIDNLLNRLCADVEVRSVGQVTDIKIYRGRDGDTSDTIGGELADEIQASPASFFVLVKTAEFPQGAIRGPIEPSS